MKSRKEIEEFLDCWENLVFLLNTLKKSNCGHSRFFREIVELLGHTHFGSRPYISRYVSKVYLQMKLTRTRDGSMRETYDVDAVIQDPKDLYDIIEESQEFISYADYHYSLDGNIAVSDETDLFVVHEEQECGFWISGIRIK